ncbi:hypothetical protein BT96DRAFT_920921 [Gymnopus androsaceus JB14]|uniref:Uncharacterized protein n=1 Tax=Gymnopus androsaceus JB14 TaxID=1447944 RepID=A0A6A4HJK9_9AGAR|nr:hypothetical protein BT96DRAFT_920921 [Gymnopus androsaceus JB14]
MSLPLPPYTIGDDSFPAPYSTKSDSVEDHRLEENIPPSVAPTTSSGAVSIPFNPPAPSFFLEPMLSNSSRLNIESHGSANALPGGGYHDARHVSTIDNVVFPAQHQVAQDIDAVHTPSAPLEALELRAQVAPRPVHQLGADAPQPSAAAPTPSSNSYFAQPFQFEHDIVNSVEEKKKEEEDSNQDTSLQPHKKAQIESFKGTVELDRQLWCVAEFLGLDEVHKREWAERLHQHKPTKR